MNKKTILTTLFAGCFALGASMANAAEAIPSEEELLTQCKQFAVEDQVTAKEMDAYVTQCVLDLKEQYLPIGTENLNPPKVAAPPPAKEMPPKDAPKPPR